MAFALATGRMIERLAASDMIANEGFGDTRTIRNIPHWLLVSDSLSQLSDASVPTWQVAFEGYLSNADEVHRQLRSFNGDPHRQPADLIAALLDENGADSLFALAGNFVLAAAHFDSDRMVILRDRLGGRTLYRHEQSDGIIISTRSRWAARLAVDRTEPDPVFMARFFAIHSTPEPGHSAFSGITELLPGERFESSNGSQRIERRPIDFETDFDYRHPGECVERFLELLTDAVHATLPPDGNVACMLSGGLDSGPAALLAERKLAEDDRQLHAISWQLSRFPDADESRWIRIAADKLRHGVDLFEGSDSLPFSQLDPDLASQDIPYYNGFRTLVNTCYQRAADLDCRVILNGNAGDELYAPLRFLNLDRLKRHQWKVLWNDLVRLWRIAGLRGILASPGIRYPVGRLLRRNTPNIQAPDWLTDHARRDWRAPSLWPPECQQTRFPEYAWQLLGTRMAFGRAHENEMPNRWGVDRRDPYQNEALVHFMLNAPFELSHRRGASKWIMRQAMRGILPDPLRRKGRTGLLNSFYQAGLETHHDAIRDLLFERQPGWQNYVAAERVEDILKDCRNTCRNNRPSTPIVLVSQCVGFALWEQTQSSGAT